MGNTPPRSEQKASPNNPPSEEKFQSRKPEIIDLEQLMYLYYKNPVDVVRYLQINITNFKNTLKHSLSDAHLVALMKIVARICQVDYHAVKVSLLEHVCICNEFLNSLSNYVASLPSDQSNIGKEHILFLEEHVVPFLFTVIKIIPQRFNHVLKKLLINVNLAVDGMEKYQNVKVSESTKNKLTQIELTLNPNHKHDANADAVQEEGRKEENASEIPNSENKHLKHVEFLISDVLPKVVKKLDVPAHKIQGIRRNIFFINTEKEVDESAEVSSFLIALAKYILKQRYRANDLLFLASDETEMRNIIDLKSSYSSLKNMRVIPGNSLENFDASIILISLDDTKAWQNVYYQRQFSKALIGAKHGIYMTGNMTLLEKESMFWKEMNSFLKKYDAISNNLPLLCDIHQAVMTVSEAADFKLIKNGGCMKRCEMKLECGHICKRQCHFYDREHKHYECHEKCSRKRDKCSKNHICRKRCHEVCGLCTVQIEVGDRIMLCHEFTKENDESSNNHCEAQDKNVTKLPCGHISRDKFESGLDLWSIELVSACQESCGASLECGHACTGTCGSCRQGRVHLPCRDKRKVTLACGHRVISVCSTQIEECNQKCFYQCPHGMCKEKCGVPCTPCKEKCVLGCEHSRCSKLCYEICDRQPCLEPCKKLLSCGHHCVGLCGEPCPSGPEFCRVCNAQVMKKRDSSGRATFVFLENCKHLIRSNELDKKAFNELKTIENLACPLCGYNITKPTRYINCAKELHRNLNEIRRIRQCYNDNLTSAFWNIFKEMKSISLPREIEHHSKLEEIKKNFRDVRNRKPDYKELLLLLFLKNFLQPVIGGHTTNMTSPHHFDWILYLLLERFEMGICSQVLKELYKEIIEYQKLMGRVYKNNVLDLHKAIAFFLYLEKNTWSRCNKGHISSHNSLLTECAKCDSNGDN